MLFRQGSGLVSIYLSGRRQRVVLNDKFSEWVKILAWVPQGSILALFLIYINDITKRIGGSIRLFTYDTHLYITLDLSKQAARVLNADLRTLSRWTNDWRVLFNANKTLSLCVNENILFSILFLSWMTPSLQKQQVKST